MRRGALGLLGRGGYSFTRGRGSGRGKRRSIRVYNGRLAWFRSGRDLHPGRLDGSGRGNDGCTRLQVGWEREGSCRRDKGRGGGRGRRSRGRLGVGIRLLD